MRVVGIGDNVVDRYINKKIMFPGGNAVNFAVFCKQCGMDSAYLGVLADDREGDLLRSSLLETGVDISACPAAPGCATERCDVILKDGDRVFVGSGWEPGKAHRDLTLGPAELAYLADFHLIHCGCYGEMEGEFCKLAALPALKTFDFSVEEEYRQPDYLKQVCPYIDMALFSADALDAVSIQAFCAEIHAYGVPYVLVTQGVKGQIFSDGTRCYPGRVERTEPVDTMGAGDSFFAAFVSSLLKSGWRKDVPLEKGPIDAAFAFAAAFAAKNCLINGAFGFGTHYE